jgi:glutamate synthase domain-containing protein 2
MDGLVFANDCLIGFDLKKDIKIIASGKIFTGFHLVKRLSFGAVLCNSARRMVLAMGCIQFLM